LHADESDTGAKVKKLKEDIDHISAKNALPTFTGKSHTPASNNGGDQPGTKRRRTGEGSNDQLEDSGYEVVPDILETESGTWGLIDKVWHRAIFLSMTFSLTIVLQLPSNIRIVYRRSDPNKTEYIAKRVRKGSNELTIHDYLRTRQSQSPHIISLIESVPSTTREWLILPKLCSIRDRWFMNSGGVAGRVRLGWGLIKGLAYLHEHKIAHRDVKPDNLVHDHDFVLKIIDFDTAIEFQDENTEIDGYCGTEGWTAPEIGTQDGPTAMYSPIKADRWSCGRVILRHIMVEKDDFRLSEFAHELMANDPQQRPSLLDWDKLVAPPVSKVNFVNRCRQGMVGFGGESVKPPDAKKPRLERGDRPELYSLHASRPMGKVF
jgi:serine/threonine protein kinase